MSILYPIQYEDFLRQALQEDLGDAGDITSAAVIPADFETEAFLLSRTDGRICGLDIALSTFKLLDPHIKTQLYCADGDDVTANQKLAVVQGNARSILSAERTALNILARLSGIASTTAQAVAQVKDCKAQVVCTRKTTPNLRKLEKYAVRIGGGKNHRFGLYDGVLIKDNHREIAGSIDLAVKRVRQSVGHMVKLEIEVDTLEQLDAALAAGVDLVLLDNMSIADLKQAVQRCQGRVITEASGGIDLKNILAVAQTGVDLISLGWLTHSAPALDVSLDVNL